MLVARRTNRDHPTLIPGVGTYFVLHDNTIPKDDRRKKRTVDLWRTQVNFSLIPGSNLIPSTIYFVLYHSNCHVVIILCDVGGGSTGVIEEPRHRPLLLVSYRTARIRELPPPADWPGNYPTQSLPTETSNGSKPLTTPNSEVASILWCSARYSTLARLPLPYLPSFC